MPQGKIQAGEPFVPSAAVWNGMVDAAEDYRRRRELGRRGGNPSHYLVPTDCVKIKNDCGANRVRGDVLEVTGLETTNIDTESIMLTGDTPTAPGQPFVVLRSAVPNGSSIVGQVSGICFARVDILDEDHTHARLKKDSFTLESHWAGPARIFHKPSGTGVKDCVVVLGESIGGGYTAFLAYGDTITARSGDTPGEGTVTLVKRDPTSGDYMNIGTALVYNDTQQTPFSSDIYIQVKVHYITADLLWDVDDCFVA